MSGRAVLIEPIGGASGNMLLGAFLDAGLTSEQVESWLRPLQLGHWRLMVERAQKHEIRAVYADYAVDSAGPSLSLAEVTEKVGKFPLSPAVVSQADSVLRKLAGARERSSGQPLTSSSTRRPRPSTSCWTWWGSAALWSITSWKPSTVVRCRLLLGPVTTDGPIRGRF